MPVIIYNHILVSDLSGNLGMLDVRDGSFEYLGNVGVRLTDITVYPDGRVFGIGLDTMYEIDLAALTATALFTLDDPASNGLNLSWRHVDGDPDWNDQLDWFLVTDLNGGWIEYSLTGEVLDSGDLPGDFISSGDVATLVRDDRTYNIVSVKDLDVTPTIGALHVYEYDFETFEFLRSYTVTHDADNLWGVAGAGEDRSVLYGFIRDQAYIVDHETAERELFADLSGTPFTLVSGAATLNYEYTLVVEPTDGADRLTGTDAADVIDALAGNDTVLGGAGADTLKGGKGADRLKGGDGRDKLSGGSSGDRLLGGAGKDELNGGKGGDVLTGGAGQDQLTGGTGTDRFVFRSATESAPGSTRDTIHDFTRGEDLIDLRAFDADTTTSGHQGFDFIAAASFSGTPGELKFRNGLLKADTDGDANADFSVAIDTGNLAETDFLL